MFQAIDSWIYISFEIPILCLYLPFIKQEARIRNGSQKGSKCSAKTKTKRDLWNSYLVFGIYFWLVMMMITVRTHPTSPLPGGPPPPILFSTTAVAFQWSVTSYNLFFGSLRFYIWRANCRQQSVWLVMPTDTQCKTVAHHVSLKDSLT